MKLCLLLLLCLLQLVQTEELSTAAPEVSSSTDEDEKKKVHACGGTFSHEDHKGIGGAVVQLGLKLLEKLPVSPQQPNVILSPLSLAFALAHLTLGAHNETEKLLLQSLHAQNLPCYHHILGSLLPHLSHTSLAVAARMYLRPGFDAKRSFVEDSLARYQSQPFPLVSVDEVNQWVENVTNGHIPNFLESIPHDVVLMLMNAVYFKGEWKTQFDPLVTSKGVFYLDNQNSVSVDMMKSARYPLRMMGDPDLQAQVASFPFKENTSFLVVLPRGNISSVLPKLNILDLYRRLPQEKTVMVNLPKVKLEFRQELEEALTKMGLGSLFSDPDLSGISDEPLRVSSVRHATTVELSEEGVEASATTVVTSTRSAIYFSVNSPFFFALIDDESLVPLFMGVVTNPAPDKDPMLNDNPHSNSTMNDQPATETCARGVGVEHSNKLSAEGSSTTSCSAPDGEKTPLQQVGGLEGDQEKHQAQGDEPCSIRDNAVPA